MSEEPHNEKRQQNSEKSHQKQHTNTDPVISRRTVCKGLLKVLMAGVLVHFGMLGDKAHAADTGAAGGGAARAPSAACPGGMPDEDICAPPTDPDRCPGEVNTSKNGPDECTTNAEDECLTGVSDADECNEPGGPYHVDQCESGLPIDDECDSTPTSTDYCVSGEAPQDHCPPTGGLHYDNCMGGGATTNGQEQDTCVGGVGDECPPAKFGNEHEDDCKEPTPRDTCSTKWDPYPLEDDTCYTGKNVDGRSNGGDDVCTGGYIASDTCITGKDDEDLCISSLSADGANDVCPGGSINVDRCEPPTSDDYCVGGLANSDECTMKTDDPDECPGGGPQTDTCPPEKANTNEDECTSIGGCSGGDRIGSDPIVDNCNAPIDACTLASPDHAE